MKRAANFGLSVLLSGLVLMALAVIAVPAVTGTQVASIDRNSMQATIPFGSLVYIRPAESYVPGDIVTFRWNGQFVTHQVIEWTPNPANAAMDGSYFKTKGTSNAEPDPYIVSKDQVVGRVMYHAPALGVVMKVLSSPSVIAFLSLVAIGLYYLSGRKPRYLLNKVEAVHYEGGYKA